MRLGYLKQATSYCEAAPALGDAPRGSYFGQTRPRTDTAQVRRRSDCPRQPIVSRVDARAAGWSRHVDAFAEQLAKDGTSAHVITADLTDTDAIPALAERIRAAVGQLDAFYCESRFPACRPANSPRRLRQRSGMSPDGQAAGESV
jgi:hypothetical protein